MGGSFGTDEDFAHRDIKSFDPSGICLASIPVHAYKTQGHRRHTVRERTDVLSGAEHADGCTLLSAGRVSASFPVQTFPVQTVQSRATVCGARFGGEIREVVDEAFILPGQVSQILATDSPAHQGLVHFSGVSFGSPSKKSAQSRSPRREVKKGSIESSEKSSARSCISEKKSSVSSIHNLHMHPLQDGKSVHMYMIVCFAVSFVISSTKVFLAVGFCAHVPVIPVLLERMIFLFGTMLTVLLNIHQEYGGDKPRDIPVESAVMSISLGSSSGGLMEGCGSRTYEGEECLPGKASSPGISSQERCNLSENNDACVKQASGHNTSASQLDDVSGLERSQKVSLKGVCPGLCTVSPLLRASF